MGALSNKGGRGQRFAHFAGEFRGFAACAPGSTKPAATLPRLSLNEITRLSLPTR